MSAVIKIPRIRPKDTQDSEEVAENKETKQEDSLLVPKTDSEKNSKLKGLVKPKKKLRIVLKIVGVASLVLLIAVFILGILFYRIYKQTIVVQSSVTSLIASASSQDIEKIKQELAATKNSVNDLSVAYQSISWLRLTPYFGRYIEDGEHGLNAAKLGLEAGEIVIETVEPYADIIGFAPDSKEAESAQETAQDRIDFVINTIPDVIPKADELAEKVDAARAEIDQINPDRYPEELAGYQIRSMVKKVIETVDLGAELLTKGKPLLEAAPYLLGVDGPRTYLILFQNDKELRPTGGFLTAYSIATVEKGKFKPVLSNDIYNIDAQYFPTIRADDPVITYLKGPYLISKNYRLRDLNWSPDFSESMEIFVEEAEKVGIKDIDGVIAVDTQLLVYLLDVLGPIGVPGFGNFSTEIVPECNCPQVIYELESFADIEGPIVWDQLVPGKIIFAPPNIDNRKKIIGPLMNSVLANALGQPKDKLAPMFEAAFKSLMEKHVLFYVFDEKAQSAIEDFGIGGTIEEYNSSGDYLHINDANLGGRKSNLYVTQEVMQEIEITKDGSVEKTLTITYKNPEKHDGWLNSVLPNWVRIYVPKDSQLISTEGLEDKKDPYEEFGKTVFSGFFELRPEGLAKVTLKYKLPFRVDEEYKLYLQKQPGTDAPLYTITIDKQEEELFLRTDKELKFKI